jgi:Na+/H+ antiporter NhaD/arsenite permease-like protein
MKLIPIIVLLAVFILTAVRKVGNVKLAIWQIMLFGALAVLCTLQIAPLEALKSINLDVMLFLFGMFVVGRALEESGLLESWTNNLFSKVGNIDILLLAVLFGAGMLSAFLMNDTVAIIGTPAALMLSRTKGVNAKLMLIALAFAVTTGSVASPIGNPQNLLIALNSGMGNPFGMFASRLLVPTLINLGITFLFLKVFFKSGIDPATNVSKPVVADTKLAFLAKISLATIAVLIAVKIALLLFGAKFDFRLTYIALVAMLPIILLSKKRLDIVKGIDWHTLVFFASMFVLMQSVWESGVFQWLMVSSGMNFSSVPVVLGVSVSASQFISNVPLVALYLPVLGKLGASATQMTALAAGSTIAGNMFILGAASTVMIIQNAEKRTGDTITFVEFAKIGVPLTVINVFVYWLFLVFL